MQAGDSTHTTTNIRRCTCEPLLVQHVNDFAGGAPLTNTVQRGAVCEPRVVLGHFSRLATQIVQNVHLKLKLSVDAVPVLNNLVLVGAQPNNDPDRQMQQRAQCLLNATIASLAIGRYDDGASLALGPQPRRLLLHALHDLQNAIVSRLTPTLRNSGKTTHTPGGSARRAGLIRVGHRQAQILRPGSPIPGPRWCHSASSGARPKGG